MIAGTVALDAEQITAWTFGIDYGQIDVESRQADLGFGFVAGVLQGGGDLGFKR